MNVSDLIEIHQLIALYGHAADGRLERLHEVFAEDGVFDTGPANRGTHRGVEQIRVFFQRVDPPHPAAHHTTNVVVYEEGGATRVLSKFLAVDRVTGGVRTGDYSDVVVRTANGWRIKKRVITAVRWH